MSNSPTQDDCCNCCTCGDTTCTVDPESNDEARNTIDDSSGFQVELDSPESQAVEQDLDQQKDSPESQAVEQDSDQQKDSPESQAVEQDSDQQKDSPESQAVEQDSDQQKDSPESQAVEQDSDQQKDSPESQAVEQDSDQQLLAGSCIHHITPPPDLAEKVKKNQMCLEFCMELIPGSGSVTGVVRLLKDSRKRKLTVRYSQDGWRTYHDAVATYMYSPDECSERWWFELPLSKKVEFAVCYRVKKTKYWDNNSGHNYVIQEN